MGCSNPHPHCQVQKVSDVKISGFQFHVKLFRYGLPPSCPMRRWWRTRIWESTRCRENYITTSNAFLGSTLSFGTNASLIVLSYLKASRGSNLLLDYAQQEVAKKERIIVENSDWLGLVPYWATWPYETMILPRSRHILRWHGIWIIRNYVLFEGWLTWQRLKDWV